MPPTLKLNHTHTNSEFNIEAMIKGQNSGSHFRESGEDDLPTILYSYSGTTEASEQSLGNKSLLGSTEMLSDSKDGDKKISNDPEKAKKSGDEEDEAIIEFETDEIMKGSSLTSIEQQQIFGMAAGVVAVLLTQGWKQALPTIAATAFTNWNFWIDSKKKEDLERKVIKKLVQMKKLNKKEFKALREHLGTNTQQLAEVLTRLGKLEENNQHMHSAESLRVKESELDLKKSELEQRKKDFEEVRQNNAEKLRMREQEFAKEFELKERALEVASQDNAEKLRVREQEFAKAFELKEREIEERKKEAENHFELKERELDQRDEELEQRKKAAEKQFKLKERELDQRDEELEQRKKAAEKQFKLKEEELRKSKPEPSTEFQTLSAQIAALTKMMTKQNHP